MAALPASGFPSRLREATASRPVGISRAPNPRCATHRGNPRRPILLARDPPPARRSAQRSEFCQNQWTLKRYATINQFWILSSAERRRGGDPESTMCSFLPHLDQDCDCAGRSHAHLPGGRWGGTVGPVSVPFLGLPRPALIEIPSLAILSPYGLRRTLVLSKFTSGISRNDARDGSRVLPVAFFIAFPLNARTPQFWSARGQQRGRRPQFKAEIGRADPRISLGYGGPTTFGLRHSRPRLKKRKGPTSRVPVEPMVLVAGAGFEPATFGL